jgi:hypothetical protein
MSTPAPEQATEFVTLRVLRPFWLNGETHKTGELVQAPALAAYDILASLRAELVDPAQRKLINKAVEHHARTFAQQRHQHWSMPAESTGNRWRINPLVPRV